MSGFEWFWDTPSWGWSYGWALAVLALPFLIAFVIRKTPGGSHPRPFIDMVAGKDGPWSTSKTAVAFWTLAIWFAFLAILFHTQGAGFDELVLQGEYFVVLGVPAAAAIVAKGLVASKVEGGERTDDSGPPHTDPVRGVGELVSNGGRTAMFDFQYFGFTLILLGFFLLRFFATPDAGLPDLPDTLLALSGVSAFAYVSKKGLEKDVGPKIISIDPAEQSPGQSITITGVNLATDLRPFCTIYFGKKVEVKPKPTDVDTSHDHVKIQVVVPQGLEAKEYDLEVEAFDGRRSDPAKFTVL